MMRDSLRCGNVDENMIHERTGMVQCEDGDGAMSFEDDVMIPSVGLGMGWGGDGIVGAKGDLCCNILSNNHIRRTSFARTVNTGSIRTGTTRNRRDSVGREMATTSPLRRTLRTLESIGSRRTTRPGRRGSNSFVRNSAAAMGVQDLITIYSGLVGKQTHFQEGARGDQPQALRCQELRLSVATQSGPGRQQGGNGSIQ